MSARRGVTALMRSHNGKALAAVNLRTGKISHVPPKVEFERPEPVAKPINTASLGNTLEESLMRIENAVATGRMMMDTGVKREIRRLSAMIERQEELLMRSDDVDELRFT